MRAIPGAAIIALGAAGGAWPGIGVIGGVPGPGPGALAPIEGGVGGAPTGGLNSGRGARASG